jgi:hypothetical protein
LRAFQLFCGCFYVYEEKLYEDLDGFDEDCFMYSDDDLSHRDAPVLAPLSTDSSQGESTVKDAMYMKRFRKRCSFLIKAF